MPNILPVRPQPVCTSSAMNRPPALRTLSATIWKYSRGGTMNPPEPMITSARIPATRPEVAVWMTSSTSLAQATSHDG